MSAVYIFTNPVHHNRTKHIELYIHFVQESVQLGDLRVLHVPTGKQYADIMTNGVPTPTIEAFRSNLCVVETCILCGGVIETCILCTGMGTVWSMCTVTAPSHDVHAVR